MPSESVVCACLRRLRHGAAPSPSGHHHEKQTVREVVKATSLAPKTVRKYLRLGGGGPSPNTSGALQRGRPCQRSMINVATTYNLDS